MHEARRALLQAAYSDPEGRMSCADIAVATGMTRNAVRLVMKPAESKVTKKS